MQSNTQYKSALLNGRFNSSIKWISQVKNEITDLIISNLTILMGGTVLWMNDPDVQDTHRKLGLQGLCPAVSPQRRPMLNNKYESYLNSTHLFHCLTVLVSLTVMLL